MIFPMLWLADLLDKLNQRLITVIFFKFLFQYTTRCPVQENSKFNEIKVEIARPTDYRIYTVLRQNSNGEYTRENEKTWTFRMENILTFTKIRFLTIPGIEMNMALPLLKANFGRNSRRKFNEIIRDTSIPFKDCELPKKYYYRWLSIARSNAIFAVQTQVEGIYLYCVKGSQCGELFVSAQIFIPIKMTDLCHMKWGPPRATRRRASMTSWTSFHSIKFHSSYHILIRNLSKFALGQPIPTAYYMSGCGYEWRFKASSSHLLMKVNQGNIIKNNRAPCLYKHISVIKHFILLYFYSVLLSCYSHYIFKSNYINKDATWRLRLLNDVA